MAESFFYLTTTGRKTGLRREIEIWYVEYQGKYYLVSERREESKWLQNLLAEPRVTFSIGPREAQQAVVALTNAVARPVSVESEVDLVSAVRRLMDAKYKWSDGLVVEIAPV
ncbi:MAG: nitroreductase family deazaflavin-dependent oxidoreductase [Polyangiaceae bacterium]|nr:nitroreductase family deazaflavin-dependent oxidoreductase [Polyangiaceae bacterium]